VSQDVSSPIVLSPVALSRAASATRSAGLEEAAISTMRVIESALSNSDRRDQQERFGQDLDHEGDRPAASTPDELPERPEVSRVASGPTQRWHR